MAAAGFKVTIQQVNGADLFTEVYEHGVGDAVLTEELTNGPDLANNFESEYTGVGFAGKQLGDDQPHADPAGGTGADLAEPLRPGPAHAEGQRHRHGHRDRGTAHLRALGGGLQQEPGGRHGRGPIGGCRSNLAGIYIKKS